ncbi:hypothetical protein BKA62DRAFT_833784 [Auriculariales sp. MPI-PUGE-AT-0066]|nr:hypothetical protein BKA62DRAFT_833784 [Auriculariales sp. MPI-PUGE-AT-0066]
MLSHIDAAELWLEPVPALREEWHVSAHRSNISPHGSVSDNIQACHGWSTISLDEELQALGAHQAFTCSRRVPDNRIILWALLPLALQCTRNLETLVFPRAVALGGIHVNAVHAAMQLKRLRRLQLPHICVTALTKLVCDLNCWQSSADRSLVVCIEGHTSQYYDIPEAVSKMERIAGVFPLLMDQVSHAPKLSLEVSLHALGSFVEMVPCIEAYHAFLLNDIELHGTDAWSRKITVHIGLSLWQAHYLPKIVKLLPTELQECVDVLYVQFKPHATDADSPTRLGTKRLVDAIETLPKLCMLSVWGIEMQEVDHVAHSTGTEVLREAHSRGLVALHTVYV